MKKKRHHYIPITYLVRFTDGAGRVFAYRKDEPRPPLYLAPSEIAFERYYYSQPLPDGGQDHNSLEDFFSTVETTWGPLAARLRQGPSGTADFTKADFESLFVFMALMRVRVPATRDLVELSRAEQVKMTARALDGKGLLPPKPEGFEDILDHMSVSIDPHQSLLAIPDLMKGFEIVLDHVGFEVLHNNTDVRFLTSDNPVICFDPTVPEERVLPYQIRPPYGAIELLLPVDEATVLRGHSHLRRPGPPILRHVTLTRTSDVKRINRFAARFAYRFVFARDRGSEALVMKYAATSPVLGTTMARDPAGRAVTVHGWVFGTRPAKPKWDPIEAHRIASG